MRVSFKGFSTFAGAGIVAAAITFGVFGLPANARAQAPAPAAPKPAEAITPDQMKGVSLDGLNDAQKKLAFSILTDNKCDCSCGMTLAQCRVKDSTCTRSLGLANQIIDLVKQGKGKDEIVKTVISANTKYVQFNLPVGESYAVGPADAKVTILYYLDYQWPFCVRVGPTFDELVKQYPNDLRLVYKMHPLDIHQNALIAARGAVAAQAQGKFSEMHHKLYENSTSLSRDKVLEVARGLGLDMDKFTKDLDSDAVKARIDREASEVTDIGATGTPAAFVNGRYVSGAKPLEFFKGMIDEELKWAKEKNRPTFTVGKNVRDAMPAQAAAAAGPDPNKVYDLPVGDAPVIGVKQAKVTILHYLDYQWPFCIRVGSTLEQLLKDYPNDVRIAYKQHPLPMHQNAMIAAEAAMAAHAQGKFKEMHAGLSGLNMQISRDKILEIAKGIGLNMDRFTKDLDGLAHKPAIEAMTKEAMTAGATGTPASFVNGRFLSGAQPYEAFKKLVDEELAKAKGGGAAGSK